MHMIVCMYVHMCTGHSTLNYIQEAEQYRKNTEEQKMQFEALKKKDENSSKQIYRQMKRIQKLQEDISSVKGKLASGAREFEASSCQIKEVRTYGSLVLIVM